MTGISTNDSDETGPILITNDSETGMILTIVMKLVFTNGNSYQNYHILNGNTSYYIPYIR
jgi:hypothetical protein